MTTDPLIEVASLRDASLIAEMSRDLIEYGLPWSWREARVARAVVAPETNAAVVREEHRLAAFGIMEYWDEDAHLVLFAVDRQFQRRGIGTALLRWLEASARAAGSARIRVEARRENIAARSFYNEYGYHETAVAYRMYSGSADGVRLEKWLRLAARE